MSADILNVLGPDDSLGHYLLEGKFISYHDPQYEMTSGANEILMKLLQQKEGLLVIFYLHVPYAYPIPEGVKGVVKAALESVIKKPIPRIEFVNAGTEAQKKDIHFIIGEGGELS